MAIQSINLKGKGGGADRGFHAATVAAGALVLVILAGILVVMTRQAWPVFKEMGLSFFTSDRWAPASDYFGSLAFIFGTLVSALIAVVIAVPVSLGIALFVTQVAPTWLRRPVVYLVDLLAVVPSVVFGLWGLLIFAPWIVTYYDKVHNAVEGIPVLGDIFGPPAQAGRSFFTAGIILAIMIVPIITSLSREVIDTTPPGEKEGALALGATRWEMIRGAVLPHSKGGLVGAVMLGLGRAMGETIAAALTIGSVAQITANMFATGDSMPAVIANQWPEADSLHKSALIGLAVTLFVMTVLVNMAANSIVQRSIKKTRGA